ncbi:MAG: SIS domain-containing protein [Anaerolineae bacterium]|jgi:glucosamine--fructose-6-phosphate aminotransferase (isomerizing)
MSLREEILEQPESLRRLIDTQWSHIRDVASAIRQREVDTIFLTARGTSDNAGLYAKYLWGAQNGLPIALAAPSLFSVYKTPPRLRRTLVLGISQSGQSPDIVSVVREGRRQGMPTLAVTNSPDSPLAEAAEWVIDIAAGPEKAVAATKSYTGQLMVIALLSVAMSGDESRYEVIRRVPGWVEEALALDDEVASIAQRYRYMRESVVLGRGYNYATAFEWALKLKELTYTVSEPYSSADFRHGPIAVMSQGFPVFAVVPQGAVYGDVVTLLQNLKQDHAVDLLVVSNADEALALGDRALRVPEAVPEWLTPIVGIVPAQLFVYHLAWAKGWDPNEPRGLRKVTKTE